MLKHRTLQPSLETLEPRQLMAVVEEVTVLSTAIAQEAPALYRGFGQLSTMGPAVYVPLQTIEVANDDTGITLASPPPAGSVIGDLNGETSNMVVTVEDGVLRIRGDAWANNFRMFGGDGTYRIEPYGTRVNGQIWSDNGFKFTGVTNGIDIDLGDGNDEVTFEMTNAPGITIRTGAGKDRLNLHGPNTNQYRSPPMIGDSQLRSIFPVPTEPVPLTITGDLFVDTGAGDDRFAGYANASGNVTIRMGDGDDSFIEGPLDYEFWRPATSRTVNGAGVRTIDLGAGQNVENIPDDISLDTELWSKMYWLHSFFEYYRGMVERGENTPGVPQLVRYVPWDNPVHVDGEGRVEVEIQFTAGHGRVIDRLIARGVTIDAYTILGGGARAVIREQDIKLFANLPELIRVNPVTYIHDGPRPVIFRWELPWDYIRPGSVPEAEEIAWGPRPPVVTDPAPVEPLPDNPILITPFYPLRVVGPVPFEQLPPPAVDQLFPSLLESFLMKRRSSTNPIVMPILLNTDR